MPQDALTINTPPFSNYRRHRDSKLFIPENKDEHVWFVLKDRKTGGVEKRKAMTLSEADQRNAIIRNTGLAWVRI